jgi:signal transduction histidine kinase
MMKHRLSLRSRIAGTILAAVTLAGVLLSVVAHYVDERLEETETYDLLSEELTHYEQRMRSDPGAEPLASARLTIYRASDFARMPRPIAALPPGFHNSIRLDGRILRVLVKDGEFGRLYVTYDVTAHTLQERVALLVLMLGLAAIIAMAAWAALGLSTRLVGPVRQLANRLSNIDPGTRHLRIAGEFAGNELEPIARSVDAFLERLDGFVEREQSFTSTASHELRTPLAVIQGAVELISEQTHELPSTTRPMDRIRRAVREMSEFTDALLTMSREEPVEQSQGALCDVTAILPRIVEDQRAIARGKHIEMTVETAAPLRVQAPDSMVAMLIGNLVRNAVQHGQGSTVTCHVEQGALTVANEGEIAPADLPHVFDRSFTTRPGGHGMGLYLVRRICERYGWVIQLASRGHHTVATVRFSN